MLLSGYYFAMNKMLSSKMLWKAKKKLNTCYTRIESVVMYACET